MVIKIGQRLSYALSAIRGLISLSVFNTSIEANIVDSYGLGGRAIANPAQVAISGDWTSFYYNLAGLALSKKEVSGHDSQSKIALLKVNERGSPGETPPEYAPRSYEPEPTPRVGEIGLSYLYQIPRMRIQSDTLTSKISDRIAAATDQMNYGSIQLGFYFDLRHIVKTPGDVAIKLGAALALPDGGLLLTVNDLREESYNFQRLGREAQSLAILPGLAVELWRQRLALGIGASVMPGGKGKFKMYEVVLDPGGQAQIPKQEVALDMSSRLGVNGGALYRQPFRTFDLTFGAAFRQENYIKLEPLEAQATTQLLQIALPIQLAVLDFYQPHCFTLGVGFRKNSWMLSLESEYQMWSRFTASSAKSTYEAAPNFKNIFLLKAGTEYAFTEALSLSAGYAYIPSFIPDQTGNSNFLDNEKHCFSTGAHYLLRANAILNNAMRIDLGIQWQYWTQRRAEKSAVNAQNPGYAYSGDLFIASLGVSWKL